MTMEWVYGLIGLVLGIASGVGLGVWLMRRKTAHSSVETIKKENEEFREQVTDHFVETAQLINQMTDSYKAVFDHLSGGADKLVDQKTLSERLPEVAGPDVQLKRLGTRTTPSAPAADVPKTDGGSTESAKPKQAKVGAQADTEQAKTVHKAPIIQK